MLLIPLFLIALLLSLKSITFSNYIPQTCKTCFLSKQNFFFQSQGNDNPSLHFFKNQHVLTSPPLFLSIQQNIFYSSILLNLFFKEISKFQIAKSINTLLLTLKICISLLALTLVNCPLFINCVLSSFHKCCLSNNFICSEKQNHVYCQHFTD